MKLTSNVKLQINQIIRSRRTTFIKNQLFLFLQKSSNNLQNYKALRKNLQKVFGISSFMRKAKL
ncbi:unnamed protein product [Paramecium pentaurelia]|uniref:Uncharacterized protein n=1 Tax=Paramecium pentaurelia TaxID=43138 RepID=A0A8S1XUV3_9CILI|nr:unnamed protein product [Paramecium pentaurelia]